MVTSKTKTVSVNILLCIKNLSNIQNLSLKKHNWNKTLNKLAYH